MAINTNGFSARVMPTSPNVDTKLFVDDSQEKFINGFYGGAANVSSIASNVQNSIIKAKQLQMESELQPYRIADAKANTALKQGQLATLPLQTEITKMQIENQKALLDNQKQVLEQNKKGAQERNQLLDLGTQLQGLGELDFGTDQPLTGTPIQTNTPTASVGAGGINDVSISDTPTNPKPLANMNIVPIGSKQEIVNNPQDVASTEDINSFAQNQDLNAVTGPLVADAGNNFAQYIKPTVSAAVETAAPPSWTQRQNDGVKKLLNIGTQLGIKPDTYKTPQEYAKAIQVQGTNMINARLQNKVAAPIGFDSKQKPIFASAEDAQKAYPGYELTLEPSMGGVAIKSAKTPKGGLGGGMAAEQYQTHERFAKVDEQTANEVGIPKEVPNPVFNTSGKVMEDRLKKAFDSSDKRLAKSEEALKGVPDGIQRAQRMLDLLDNGLGTGVIEGSGPVSFAKRIFGDSNAIETFNADAAIVARSLRQPGEGSMSDWDGKQFKIGSPSLDKDEGTNRNLLQAAVLNNQNKVDRDQFLRDYRSINGHLEGADAAWKRYLNANPIVDPAEPLTDDSQFKLNEKRVGYQDYFKRENEIGIEAAKKEADEMYAQAKEVKERSFKKTDGPATISNKIAVIPETVKKTNQYPTISSQAEFDALPEEAFYFEDGKVYQKPKKQ